mmetsp:Transcript_22648/g.27781  ORF Transcript_22648/g.27781 Transcript_22648/m.27781 type:complete len:223 (-) Transcript_22648:79-747(-)
MSKLVPPGTLQGFEEDDEIKLYDSGKERILYDNYADLYAIIMTVESLERSYARNDVTRDEYVSECNKLISQFRIAEKTALQEKESTETFMQIYQMDCPLASHRLLVAGVPETMVQSDTDNRASIITVAETTEHFINVLDALKLEVKAVDELQPLLSDLMNKLARLKDTPNDFEPNRVIQQWLQKLNLMRAIDEIDEADARQLSMDLDEAYQEFKRFLLEGNN